MISKARLVIIGGGVVCAAWALFDTNINWYKVGFFGFIVLTNLINYLEENK